LWAAAVARANQRRLELALDHRLNELTHPLTQPGFDGIEPIVEKMDRRRGFRLQGRRRRAIVGHGAVSTGVCQRRDCLGFSTRRLRPMEIFATASGTMSVPQIAPCMTGCEKHQQCWRGLRQKLCCTGRSLKEVEARG